jgi:uncharacterized peroxidase-related enzyme
MPFIPLEEHLPGITGLLEYSRETATPIRELTQILLRGPSTLSEVERELIAVVVSQGNQCIYCSTAHAAAVECLGGDKTTVDAVRENPSTASVSPKMKTLLHIASLVRVSGKAVTADAIDAAKIAGATDLEIHDTVLIAALFCLYNRYVDGLATVTPEDPAYYADLGNRLSTHGYYRLPQGYDHLKNIKSEQ